MNQVSASLFLRSEPQGRRGWGPSPGALTMLADEVTWERLYVHTELFVYVGAPRRRYELLSTREPLWGPDIATLLAPPAAIILATLVDRPFQMIYANIQPQAILGLENKIFKCFFPYKCIGKQT